MITQEQMLELGSRFAKYRKLPPKDQCDAPVRVARWIKNHVFLSNFEKKFLAQIAYIGRHQGMCWAGDSYFTEFFKVKESKIKRILRMFKGVGLVTIDRDHGQRFIIVKPDWRFDYDVRTGKTGRPEPKNVCRKLTEAEKVDYLNSWKTKPAIASRTTYTRVSDEDIATQRRIMQELKNEKKTVHESIDDPDDKELSIVEFCEKYGIEKPKNLAGLQKSPVSRIQENLIEENPMPHEPVSAKELKKPTPEEQAEEIFRKHGIEVPLSFFQESEKSESDLEWERRCEEEGMNPDLADVIRKWEGKHEEEIPVVDKKEKRGYKTFSEVFDKLMDNMSKGEVEMNPYEQIVAVKADFGSEEWNEKYKKIVCLMSKNTTDEGKYPAMIDDIADDPKQRREIYFAIVMLRSLKVFMLHYLKFGGDGHFDLINYALNYMRKNKNKLIGTFDDDIRFLTDVEKIDDKNIKSLLFKYEFIPFGVVEEFTGIDLSKAVSKEKEELVIKMFNGFYEPEPEFDPQFAATYDNVEAEEDEILKPATHEDFPWAVGMSNQLVDDILLIRHSLPTWPYKDIGVDQKIKPYSLCETEEEKQAYISHLRDAFATLEMLHGRFEYKPDFNSEASIDALKRRAVDLLRSGESEFIEED